MHAACLAVIWVGFSWVALVVAVALYVVRMFAITGFYHRYFSHRTFKTSRVGQFIFGLLGCLRRAARPDLVGGPSPPPPRPFGQARGRAFADAARLFLEPHGLVHVPQALRGGSVAGEGFAEISRAALPGPLRRGGADVPGRRRVSARRAAQACRAGAAHQRVADAGLGVLHLDRAVYHGTYTINSLSHVFGRQRYKTGDASRNNPWLAIITLGEGWHNNHHHYPASVRQGFYWWEFDVTFYMLKLMSFFGVIWDLKPVPAAVREGGGQAALGSSRRLTASRRRRGVSSSMRSPKPETLAELKDAVGHGDWLDSHGDLAPYTRRFSAPLPGRHAAGAACRAASTRSRGSCRSAIATKSRVVPHGGNTSYCGGATPDESGSQIVVVVAASESRAAASTPPIIP